MRDVGFSVVIAVVGLLVIFLGLSLRYVPFNNAGLGLKFPWILHDEEAWNVTHRISSRLWVLGGLISIAFAFLPTTTPSVIAYFVLFFACMGIGPLVCLCGRITGVQAADRRFFDNHRARPLP